MHTKQRAIGQLDAIGATPVVYGRACAISVTGPFTGTVTLQVRSRESGKGNLPWVNDYDFSQGGVRIGRSVVDLEWRLDCSSFTSGPIFYRLEASSTIT